MINDKQSCNETQISSFILKAFGCIAPDFQLLLQRTHVLPALVGLVNPVCISLVSQGIKKEL